MSSSSRARPCRCDLRRAEPRRRCRPHRAGDAHGAARSRSDREPHAPASRSRRRIASWTQGADPRCGDPCRCEPYRPRRQAARGATQKILPFKVMAPSTLGTFLRAFTFGHIRQLDSVIAEAIRRAWHFGAGPRSAPVTLDVDSTICEVHGDHKQGAAYGYTKVLGYHPLLATRADTGEVLHARLRKGSSQRGTKRFIEELVARVRRCGAKGALTLRADAGFFSYALIDTLDRLKVRYSITLQITPRVQRFIDAIEEAAFEPISYPDSGEAQVAETTYVAERRGGARRMRLVVRRTRLSDPRQQQLWPAWRYHCFVTNVDLGHGRCRRLPPRSCDSRACDQGLERRIRARTLPVGKVLRQRRLARLRGPRPRPRPLDRTVGQDPPSIRAHRRPHSAHACARLARSPRQPQRSADPPTPKSLALGIQLSQQRSTPSARCRL